ncbi:spore germination protein KB [Paenibacillus sp. CCS19]|uniref:GerAB/ArcD/ProY family transporter n=1 Tax=Paenibacillus sp. CCS19 TaxID=3158387 RepID=UPI002561AABC|nr:GerAB/ArcD/ProY family transporter [Paenibacillus cellulosilyticus]GMK38068.1 spore germination protein KB [Paenibacillus cellulosilyticus]
MKTKLTISPWQLFALIVLFELGSAIVMNVGHSAKQDAWISIAAATIFGMGIFAIYRLLQARRPESDLFELVQLSFGRWLGSVVILLYVIYFLYVAARVLRDFLELLASAVLDHTPIEVLAFSFMLVSAYMIGLGLSTIVRTAELLFPIIMGILFVLCVLLLIDRDYEFNNLKPILGDGIEPVVTSIFPTLLTFPFGELIVILVFIRYAAPAKRVGFMSMGAIGLSGMILVGTAVLETITLGEKMKERTNFPYLLTIRDIAFGYFFERMEMMVVFVMFITILVKASLFLFGALKGVEHLVRIPYRESVFPVACLVAILSIRIATSFAEHSIEGLELSPYVVHLPMQLGIPLVMLVILGVKSARQR